MKKLSLRTSFVRSGLLTSLIGVLLLAETAPGQRSVRLSGPMVSAPFGSVQSYLPSPDGSRFLYLADRDTEHTLELYSVPADGSAEPVKLNAPGNPVSAGYAFTPDGSRALFESAGELWSAPVDGSAPPVMLASSTSGPSFATPDGATAVYLLAGDVYRIPIDGSGPPVRLSDPALGVGSVFGISSDGSRAVYRVDVGGATHFFSSLLGETEVSTDLTPNVASNQVYGASALAGAYVVFELGAGSNIPNLYRAPLDGSGPVVRLNPGSVPGVDGFRLSPDASRVVFRGFQTAGKWELFSVPTDASSAAIRINESLPPNGDVGRNGYEVTPNGQGVVYTARKIGDLYELYLVPIDVAEPTAALRLSGTFLHQGKVRGFDISDDGLWVAYVADQDTAQIDLYTASLDGSSGAVRVDTQGFGTSVKEFATAGADRVVYSVEEADVQRLYSALRDASQPPTDVSGALVLDGIIQEIATAPGGLVVYRADQDVRLLVEVFSVPADGADGPQKISGEPGGTTVGDVQSFRVDPTGRRAVYSADQITDNVEELFSASLVEPGPPVRLNTDLPGSGEIAEFDITANGEWVVYRAEQEAEDRFEVFRVPIDGSLPPARVTDPLPTGGNVIAWSLEGSYVVYTGDCEVDGRSDLFSIPFDGSSGAVRLNTDPGRVGPYVVDDAKTRVAYRSDLEVSLQYELYSAPIDGSGPSIKLSGPMVVGGDIDTFAITPDGSHAVYRADQDADNVYQLYSVPTDGSAPPTALNGPLPPGGDVKEFQIDPGGRVVYTADEAADEVLELYTVGIDGTGRSKLNGSLVSSGEVREFLVGPGGYVLYLADQDVPFQEELFGVPVDGSRSAVRLNGPMALGGDVLQFRFDPTGALAVYVADQVTDGIRDMFSAPVDGRRAPTPLTSLPAGQNAGLLDVAGGRVLHLMGTGSAPTWWDLYVVPIQGGGAQLQNDPLALGGSVLVDAQFRPGSQEVVYRADQDVQGVFELYRTRTIRPRPQPTSTRVPPAGHHAAEH